VSNPLRQVRVMPLRTLSDERLVQLAGMGHSDAFGTLYERYREALARYCRSIVRDPQDAGDALQSTMLCALRAVQARGGPSGHVRPWLYRIAHNESISIIRRRRPYEELSIETPDSAADTELASAAKDRLDALLVDLRSLPERQRGAIVMRELSGLAYDEIGDALSMSAVSARKAVFEARVALHDLADGRDADCGEIRRRISDGDGRVLRARGIRGHLRDCASCSSFHQGVGDRRGTLALIPVFPAISAGALLGFALPGAGGASTSSLAAGGSAAGGAAAGGSAAGGSALSGSVFGGASVAAVKGIALGGVIAAAGAGAFVGTRIGSRPVHPHRIARAAAAHVGGAPQDRVGAVAAAPPVKPVGVVAGRTHEAPKRHAAGIVRSPAAATAAGRTHVVASVPNAQGPSVALPVAGAPTSPASTTTSTPTPTSPPPSPTTTVAAAPPPARPADPATQSSASIKAIVANALAAADAEVAAAEAQAKQAVSQAAGPASTAVQNILGSVLHGGAG